jgi:hypothetical protein
MRVMKIRKDKTFLEMKSNQNSAKDQVVPKNKKIDRGFLGCVECSTNGDLLGKSRISIPTSGSSEGDSKVD